MMPKYYWTVAVVQNIKNHVGDIGWPVDRHILLGSTTIGLLQYAMYAWTIICDNLINLKHLYANV